MLDSLLSSLPDNHALLLFITFLLDAAIRWLSTNPAHNDSNSAYKHAYNKSPLSPQTALIIGVIAGLVGAYVGWRVFE